MVTKNNPQPKTSQLYFQGSLVAAPNEVAFICFADPKLVCKHFGIEHSPEASKDYGFCKLRISELGVVEFVTDDVRKLSRLVEGLRAYVKRYRLKRNLFTMKVYGDQGAIRRVRIEGAALKAGAIKDNARWTI